MATTTSTSITLGSITGITDVNPTNNILFAVVDGGVAQGLTLSAAKTLLATQGGTGPSEIGRASCRERV